MYDMSYLLDACQIGQVQKTLKNLRPSGEKLASSSSQKVHFSHICYIIDFIVHISYHICQSTLHCSCFISLPQVHTSLIMFHFYFLQSTVHLIHFTYHSPSRSCLPYLVVFILHGHSTSLSVSLSSQSRLWKLTTYECL